MVERVTDNDEVPGSIPGTPTMIEVSAGIIERDGKFLIAKRKKEQHLGDRWEFPGGKIEPQESSEDCIVRELKEEFGIMTEVAKLLGESVFDYGDRKVRLFGYLVNYISGEIKPHAHDEIRWISLDEFAQFDFVEADRPFIEKLRGL